ncbi:MAG: TIGR04283 family arsenosugar biosynthesis glycosyltransferase [Actinomycetia bacterium]|nr:TIGR04283 family arsenosugar biosynthesis glycosyltransferase [Actinomycetes bacterium]
MTRSGRADIICVLARFPRLGEVKTRLAPPLSPAEALDLHERLTRQAVRSARALVVTGEAKAELRTDAAFQRAASEWLHERDIGYRYQGTGDLGDRIALAFHDAFRRGAERVIVVGSDCPRLSAPIMRDALGRLSATDVVLGPAEDGGYYLIGLRREAVKAAVPALFSGLPWGSSDVFARTLELAEDAGLGTALLKRLPDVDRPEDLLDAEIALRRARVEPGARVSVIIPALDDATLLGAAVTSARAAGAVEVIVVDGGSRDGTRRAAEATGAHVLDAPTGRATQMNAGAAAAAAEVLLFLHADTTLPAHACRLAVSALATPGVVAGGFSYSVPAHARHARIISAVGRARGILGGLPWGDQALFMSRDTFTELGGFPGQPAMEDYELAHRLADFGRVVTLPDPVITSARAWDKYGLLLPTAMNLAVIAAYRAGVDTHRLARWRSRIAPGSSTR